jgi:hypothetical protein
MTQAEMQRIRDQAYVTDAALFYQGHRKDMLLQWLRMLWFLEKEISNAATHVAGSAALAGANYRELGAAWGGITRQAARMKWAAANRDGAAPDAGDRVRLTYGDGSSVEGTWELTPNGPALRLDDGTLHEHVTGQVRREVIELAP